MELTSEQKHDISVQLNASDIYETVPFLNKVLAAIGYVDRLDDDSEREELRWTKRKEPLIGDKKIREAIKTWAKAAYIDDEQCVQYDEHWESFRSDDRVIGFKGESIFKTFGNLDDGKWYTIDELCGEEEE